MVGDEVREHGEQERGRGRGGGRKRKTHVREREKSFRMMYDSFH